MVGKMRWETPRSSGRRWGLRHVRRAARQPGERRVRSRTSSHLPLRSSPWRGANLTAHRTFPQPRQVIGPDANGVKTYIDYKVKDDGLKVRDRTSRPRPNPSGATQTFFSTHRRTRKLCALRRDLSLTSHHAPFVLSSVQVRTVKKVRVHTETKKVTPAMAARKRSGPSSATRRGTSRATSP